MKTPSRFNLPPGPLLCRESADMRMMRDVRERSRRAMLFTVFWLFAFAVDMAWAWLCFLA